ncbi:hypothetical protein Acr_11g0003900 [Actinidia rufa]|uniref:Uncharacterized protein n=1 Tax=Actinidia rufa TaxID=165716 RepID=A0A7J0FBH4_9ERIC|nr:hypothetical protein Acr_11g0003900 [Actinidia rufa]
MLNVDWFPAAEPSLKRVHIQNLICKILETENSAATCSGNRSASISIYPQSNNEIETGVELISERCSPSKSCRKNLDSSPADRGIEITLLPAASECAGDSGLVLREFFEAGDTTGSFLDGPFQTFDRAASFNEFKGVISSVEEDAEAGGQFVYSESHMTDFQQTAEIGPEACVFPYSSRGFGAETSWNPGIHESGLKDIDTSSETSNCAFDDPLEVEAEGKHTAGEDCGGEEKIDQPGSPSMEKVECLRETLGSATIEMVDIAHSQSSDHIVDSNGNANQPRSPLMENIECLRETLGSTTIEMVDIAHSQSSDHIVDSNGNANQPRSPLMKNMNCLTESLASVPSEMLDMADTLPSDHVLDSNGNAEHLISSPTTLVGSHEDGDVEENGDDTCAEDCLVGDASLSETNRQEVLERLDDDSVPEPERQEASKRIGDDLVPESEDVQPAKRLRLSPPSEGERTLKRSLSKDQLL